MLRRDRRGVAAVETALVMPLLCTLMLGAWDIGSALFDRSRLAFAAEQAAVCWSQNLQCLTAASAASYADQVASDAGLVAAAFSAASDLNCVHRVRGNLTYKPIGYEFGGKTIPMSVSACAP